jgi:hypothetical protein
MIKCKVCQEWKPTPEIFHTQDRKNVCLECWQETTALVNAIYGDVGALEIELGEQWSPDSNTVNSLQTAAQKLAAVWG